MKNRLILRRNIAITFLKAFRRRMHRPSPVIPFYWTEPVLECQRRWYGFPGIDNYSAKDFQ